MNKNTKLLIGALIVGTGGYLIYRQMNKSKVGFSGGVEGAKLKSGTRPGYFNASGSIATSGPCGPGTGTCCGNKGANEDGTWNCCKGAPQAASLAFKCGQKGMPKPKQIVVTDPVTNRRKVVSTGY